MKKIIHLFLVLSWIIVGVFSAATASAYTFVLGPNSVIDTSGTNDVLQLEVLDIAHDLALNDVEIGVPRTFYFATIGTNESWINRDDIEPGTVEATVDFLTPPVSPVVGGESVGFRGFFSFFQGWSLIWDDPVNVVADGYNFDIELKDVGYTSWFWQGPAGTADILATITLNSVEAVPVPAAVWLLGTGMVGLILVRRRGRVKEE